ncbi:MAG TPA: hypothetical protein VMT01_00030 [Candidatus Acidoferrum sp.]|jgi:uncharacterized protein YcsI (UPF0317 family)|nr:hypothetical protein [Candidatus Acidoferrum sp.]
MRKLRIAAAVLCVVIVTSAISSYVYACGGFDFLLYDQNTQSWNIPLGTTHLQEPKTMKITAQSNDKKNERVIYNVEIRGPKGFSNKDIVLSWQDSDGKNFTIGQGGTQSFKGTTILCWQSGVIVFKAKHKNNITLVLTFLKTAHLGKYSGEIWISET